MYLRSKLGAKLSTESLLPSFRPCHSVPLLRYRSVVVLAGVFGIIDRVVGKASILVVGQLVRILLTRQELIQWAKAIGTAVTRTAPNGIERENPVVQADADELVRGRLRVVSVLPGIILRAGLLDCQRVRAGAANGFRDQPASERSQVRKHESPVRVWWIPRERWRITEIVEGEGGKGRDDDVILCTISCSTRDDRGYTRG